MAMLHASGLVFLRRPRMIIVSVTAAAFPVAGLAAFNKFLYGEWFGHVTHNLDTLCEEGFKGLLSMVKLRAGFLWTSLLGINAPQTLTAEQAGWERSLLLIRPNNVLEILAFCALGGMAACSVIGSRLGQYHQTDGDDKLLPQHPTGSFPRVLAIQIGLLWVLAGIVTRYVLTFPQDHSPLITVLKSGGVFTFSPFLATVLIWPLIPIKDRPQAGEFKWLFYTSLIFILVIPVLSPNDGGIRYGARYLLPAIAMLTILAVVVFHRRCSGIGCRLFQAALVVLVVLSVVIEARGYQVLYHKKGFSRDFTTALLANPIQRVGVSTGWIPFEAPRL